MDGGVAGQRRTLVVVNPASAGGRTARRWPRLRDALYDAGVEFDVFLTSTPGDATVATSRALRNGYTCVVATGGDGTLNEVVNGFHDADGTPLNGDAVLGLLPSGTGGDFRRAAGIPTRSRQLAAMLVANHVRIVDLGRVTYDDPGSPPRLFVNIADCGVGGEVVARVNRNPNKGAGLRGTAVFLGVSLSALATFDGRPVRLTLDDKTLEVDVQNVVVANGRYFAGGMRIAPDAVLDDGLFDVVVIPVMGRVRTLAAIPSVYRGAHLHQPGVLLRRVRTIRVEPLDDRPLLFDVEGEQVGRAPATLTCIPRAIRLCVPPPGSAQS